MTVYRQGYEVYVKKCEQFGLEPINFHYYVLQLTTKQLNAFNHQATQQEEVDYCELC